MKITKEIAKKAGDALRIDWSKVSVDELAIGMDEEQEHDTGDPQTDVLPGSNNILSYAKIALAHLREDPKYYSKMRGDKMKEAVENRLAIVPGDEGLNLVDLNTGRRFATGVDKWDYRKFLRAFKELDASGVEVRASSKGFLKDGFYRAKDFLVRLSRLNPGQGQTIPIVRGQPVQAAEGKRPWAFDESGSPYNENALLEKILDYLQGSSQLHESAQGKNVEINKPFKTKTGYAVYIKESGKIKRITFGNKK